MPLDKAILDYYNLLVNYEFYEDGWADNYESVEDFTRESLNDLLIEYNGNRSHYAGDSYSLPEVFCTGLDGKLYQEIWDKEDELDILYPILLKQLEDYLDYLDE